MGNSLLPSSAGHGVLPRAVRSVRMRKDVGSIMVESWIGKKAEVDAAVAGWFELCARLE